MAVIPDTHNTGLTPTQIDTAFSNALTHTPSDSTPKEDGSGSAGEAETFARSDHEHPHDTTKQDTLAFEGTYNASTNKVTTMSAVKDGKLTGYAQSSGNVAATDKVIEAIGKVEKKADDNKTNISKLVYESVKIDKLQSPNTTWTASATGLYYSNTFDLTTVKTILGYTVSTFAGLSAEPVPVIAQNDTNAGLGKFALLSTTGTFNGAATITYRIWGTTDTP